LNDDFMVGDVMGYGTVWVLPAPNKQLDPEKHPVWAKAVFEPPIWQGLCQLGEW